MNCVRISVVALCLGLVACKKEKEFHVDPTTHAPAVAPAPPPTTNYATISWEEFPKEIKINHIMVYSRESAVIRMDELGYSLLYEHGKDMAFRSKLGVHTEPVSIDYSLHGME